MPANPQLLVRSLARRYLFVLLAVACLVMVDQAIIQPQLVRLNLFAPAINVAGRQRMLSQNIAKHSLALAAQPRVPAAAARRERLKSLVDQWEAAHQGLLEGSVALGLEPLADAPAASALRALEPAMISIRSAALALAESEMYAPAQQAALETILSAEPRYLHGMEQVVEMLTTAAGRRVDFLRAAGIGLMIVALALLAGAYAVVVRPALGLIRRQIAGLARSEARHRRLSALLEQSRHELELRVTQRTAELLAANRTLRHEIAERAAAERRTHALSEALAHASRVTALGQLATGLAHEINQPLATIANYADVLELAADAGSADRNETRETVAQLKRAALRAGQIVRRMRNFIQRTSGAAHPVEVNPLVREVCELCRPQLKQAEVRLGVELTEAPTFVLADALEIQQVLVNLVQNAVQALEECPSERREIQLRSYLDSEQVHVELADTGPGFRGKVAEAFAPFVTSKPEGLGMGLAITRTILDRYHGRLWGRDRDRGGAVVGFSLPLATTHECSACTPADCVCR